MMTRKIIGILIALAALLTTTGMAFTQTQPEVREEFHQTYPLNATGRVNLENLNGAVHITTWDRNEIKVDAVKTAPTRERLSEAEIKIDSFSPDSINIHTDYPRFTDDSNGKHDRRHEEPASVEYTLTVPRSARLESIELINGALDIDGVAGEVKASSINGRLKARGLTNEAKLSTINGSLEATFERLDAAQSITLNSVNGQIILTIPSDANAQLRANTVHGNISNDFGLPVRRGEYVGRDLAGTLGSGGTRIKLGNVNGQIRIQHAADGRPVSAATSLLQENDRAGDVDVGDLQDEIESSTREATQAAADAAREAADAAREATRDTDRATREAQRETARAAREVQRETARAAREAQREVERNRAEIERAARTAAEIQIRETDTSSLPLVDRQTKSFNVGGTPHVNVETFDGTIAVHAWNKPEVSATIVKRARDDQTMRGIRLRTEQRGGEIVIVAEFAAARNWGTGAVVQFDLYVPQSTNLRASSGDGRLLVEGVGGEMDLHTGDGSVDVNNGRGRLRVNTGDGRIRIADFDGDVNAVTGDGRITLAGRFTQLSARTGDGSISLALPADFNATIETNAESVINDGLTVSEDKDATRRVRRWKVGRGGPVFTLNTGDGRIILERADTSFAGQE
jgi:DUF4097 and DUF4098 domain-containing protein YvlB